jgi:Rrf2 family iron-sulfur cluster assembly transcriptional regulator
MSRDFIVALCMHNPPVKGLRNNRGNFAQLFLTNMVNNVIFLLMRLSTKSRYGVRAVFDIAYHGGGAGAQIKDIARRQVISPRYLEQIFQKLRDAGILISKRGPMGGYSLAKSPEEIKVGDIIRVTEGGLDPVFCVQPKKSGKVCDHIAECVTRPIWKEAGERFEDFFDSITIQDLCRKAEILGIQREYSQGVKYYI